MKFKLFQARFKTGGKTPEQIIESYSSSKPDNGEIQRWIEAYNIIDGLEVAVMEGVLGDGFHLIGWNEKDDHKVRDFVYAAEQDPIFGTYIDEYEEFCKDWKSEKYEPVGALTFVSSDIEIVEEIKTVPKENINA